MLKKYIMMLFMVVCGLFLPYGQMVSMDEEKKLSKNDINDEIKRKVCSNRDFSYNKKLSEYFMEKIFELGQEVEIGELIWNIMFYMRDPRSLEKENQESVYSQKVLCLFDILKKLYAKNEKIVGFKSGVNSGLLVYKGLIIPNFIKTLKEIGKKDEALDFILGCLKTLQEIDPDEYLSNSNIKDFLKEHSKSDDEKLKELATDGDEIEINNFDTIEVEVQKIKTKDHHAHFILGVPLMTSVLISLINKLRPAQWKSQLLLHGVGFLGAHIFNHYRHNDNSGVNKEKLFKTSASYVAGWSAVQVIPYLYIKIKKR